MRPFEGCLDMCQVVSDGLTVEMIDHQTLATGGSALHLHHAIADIEGHHLPMGAFEFFQPEFQDFPQGLALRIFQLGFQHILRRPGELAVLDIRGDIVGMPLPIGHHLAETAVGRVFGGYRQRQGCHTLACEAGVDEDGLAGTLLQWHPGASEGPACAGGHIHLDSHLPAVLLHLAQHGHPLVAEIGNVVCLVALHPIDGRDLQGTDAMIGVLLHGPAQVFFVDGRTEPPPAGAGLGLLTDFWPLLRCGSRSQSGQNGKC